MLLPWFQLPNKSPNALENKPIPSLNRVSGKTLLSPRLVLSLFTLRLLILPEALLLGYKITGERRYLEVSEKTLNFLIKHTFKDSMYIPIGQSGWFPKAFNWFL
jgi:hypothetical protein